MFAWPGGEKWWLEQYSWETQGSVRDALPTNKAKHSGRGRMDKTKVVRLLQSHQSKCQCQSRQSKPKYLQVIRVRQSHQNTPKSAKYAKVIRINQSRQSVVRFTRVCQSLECCQSTTKSEYAKVIRVHQAKAISVQQSHKITPNSTEYAKFIRVRQSHQGMP